MTQETPTPEVLKPDLLIRGDGPDREIIILNKELYPYPEDELYEAAKDAAGRPLLLLGGLAVASYAYFAGSDELPKLAEVGLGTLFSLGPSLNYFRRRLMKKLYEQ